VAALHLRPVRPAGGRRHTGRSVFAPACQRRRGGGGKRRHRGRINRDSQLVYTATATGAYYVEAGAFDDSYTGTYKASVAGTNLVDDSITRLYAGYFNRAPDPAARPIGRHSCRAAWH